jgi:hypothetical protein
MHGDNASDQGASGAPLVGWFHSSVILTNFLSPFQGAESCCARPQGPRAPLRFALAPGYLLSRLRRNDDRNMIAVLTALCFVYLCGECYRDLLPRGDREH